MNPPIHPVRTRITPRAFLVLVVAVLPFMGTGWAAAENGPAPAEPSTEVLARYAVMLGDRSQTPAGAPDADAADELLTWDYRRDHAELAHLFGLTHIATLQLGSARLDAAGGSFSATSPVDGETLTVKVQVEIKPFEGKDDTTIDRAAFFQLEIWQGETLLSAPRVVNVLGERAIVTTAMDERPRILWVVVQLDDLPLKDES